MLCLKKEHSSSRLLLLNSKNVFSTIRSIIKIKNKVSFSSFVKKSIEKKVLSFVLETKLDELIETSSLDNWNDVVDLSNKIYDLLFSEKRNRSDKNTIEDADAAIETAIKNIEFELEKYNDLKNNEIKSLLEKLNKKKAEKDQLLEKVSPTILSLNKELENYYSKMEEVDSFLELRERLSEISNKKLKIKEKIVTALEQTDTI